MREQVIQQIIDHQVIAIIRGLFGEDCLKLAKALYAGGIRLMECTFDPVSEAERERTADTIRLLVHEMGDRMSIGAGTVTSVDMVRMAKAAGAQFIVSPNTDAAVIRATVAADMVSVPGALTPTEIKFAHDCGGDFIKVFPACTMGADYFRNVHAPLRDCRLLAVGNVTEKDAADYLAAGCCGVGIGGYLYRKDWVSAGEWDKITEAARALTDRLK